MNTAPPGAGVMPVRIDTSARAAARDRCLGRRWIDDPGNRRQPYATRRLCGRQCRPSAIITRHDLTPCGVDTFCALHICPAGHCLKHQRPLDRPWPARRVRPGHKAAPGPLSRCEMIVTINSDYATGPVAKSRVRVARDRPADARIVSRPSRCRPAIDCTFGSSAEIRRVPPLIARDHARRSPRRLARLPALLGRPDNQDLQ
jgi:hypothetical protein